MTYNDIAHMNLRYELDIALEDTPSGKAGVFVDQLATTLAPQPDTAVSFLGLCEKLAGWYEDCVRPH